MGWPSPQWGSKTPQWGGRSTPVGKQSTQWGKENTPVGKTKHHSEENETNTTVSEEKKEPTDWGVLPRRVGCSRRPVGWSSRSVRTGSPTHGPTRLTRPRSRHLVFARAFERAVLAALLSNATPADAALLHEAWAARAAAATQGRPGAGTRGASHARPGRPPRSTQPSRSCTQLQHQHLGLHPARSLHALHARAQRHRASTLPRDDSPALKAPATA